MPPWLLVLGLLVALAGVLFAAHRLLLWMDRRQWIFYRGRFRRGFGRPANESSGCGGMAGLLTSFQQLVEPEIRYVMEEKDQRQAAAADEASPADR